MGKVESSDPNKVTQEVIAAPAQAVDMWEVKKNDGTVVGKVDKDGYATFTSLVDKWMDGDVAVLYEGGLYIAKNIKTGATISSGATRQTVFDAAIEALPEISGYGHVGTIIDFSGHVGFGNNAAEKNVGFATTYCMGYPYDRSHMLDVPFWLEPMHVISNFDGGVGVEWVFVSGDAGAGIADDTTYVLSGEKSVKVTIPASDGITAKWCNLDLVLANPIDLRRCNFYVRAYTDAFGYNVAFDGLGIMDADHAGWSGYYMCGGTNCVNYSIEGYELGVMEDGWVEWFVDPMFMTTQYGGDGVVDWSRCKTFRLKMFSYATREVHVYLDTLQAFQNKLRRGTVVFSQDEGQNTWDYTRPKFDKYNYRPSISWEANNLTLGGFEPVYPNGMLEMYKLSRYKGYDMCSHGYEHLNMGAQTRPEGARRFLRDVRAMDVYGWHSNQKNLISAGGSCGFEMGNTWRAYAYLNRGTLNYLTGFPMGALYCLPCLQDPTEVGAKAQVDVAQDQILLFNCLVHTVGPGGSWTTAELDDFLLYCKGKNVDVLDYTALVEMYLKSSKNKCRDWERWVTYDSL